MISEKQSPSPISNHQIDQLRMRLDSWRKSHRPRSRIPGRLWDSAVRLAAQYGLNKTAKALRLDYYDLQKRLSEVIVSSEPVPSFIELSPAVPSPSPECVIELESRDGAKMRIHLKGTAVPDLNALSLTFWGIPK